jgi:hypothetical protein
MPTGGKVSRIKKAITFSNVIAVIALFLALGGSVYAASGKISGKQIKPKSLPGNRIKPRGITEKQIRPGTITGQQVKAGSLTGREVVGSSLTGVTASSLGAVQYASVSVSMGRGGQVGPTGTAGCPTGMKVIGGGATVSDDNSAYVNDSGPTDDHDGWTATGWSGKDGVTMTVTAICTVVTTTTGSAQSTRVGPIYNGG